MSNTDQPPATPLSAKVGAAPGALIHVGAALEGKTLLSLMEFSERELAERDFGVDELAEVCAGARQAGSVTWINVTGTHDPAIIKAVSDGLQLHPLTAEDIMNASQRPKVEDFPDYRFLALKMVDVQEDEIAMEHVSIVVAKGLVVSFQERPGDVFDPIRERIRSGRGLVRHRAADYLAYALLDAIVDYYFVAMESLGDQIESIEERLLGDGDRDRDVLAEIYAVKRSLIHVRRAVWPLRSVVDLLEGDDSKLVSKSTRAYFRDIQDHVLQIIELVETSRELIAGVRDHHMTIVSNGMNTIMKVLTVIGTIFLPLGFIVGVYGMNFAVMPELQWRWGYAAIWLVMLVIVAGLLLFFRRKRWL